jgi:hypothetical protein
MKLAAKLFKNSDSYGKGVTLNINGKETINSTCGGLFSLINLMFFIVIFLINFYQFASTPTALITVSEIFRPLSDMETISEKNFMLSNFFSTVVPGFPPIPIANLPNYTEGTEMNIKMENGKIRTKMTSFGKLDDCSENKIYTENKNFKNIYNKIKNLSTEKILNCFNFETENFTAGGNIITSDESTFISIDNSYDLCILVNKTLNCNITKEDMYILSKIKLMTIVKNNYINKDQREGYNEMFQTLIDEIDFAKDLNIKIKAKRINITTDNNLLYNINPNIDTNTIIYDFETRSLPRRRNINEFTLTYEVVLDSYTTVVERSYLKLDGMLANLGSIVTIIEFLVKFLAGFFSEGNMEHSIYKEIFHIKKKKYANVDPKIFSEIVNKLKDNKVYKKKLIINDGNLNDIELQDINKDLPKNKFNKLSVLENVGITQNEKVEHPDVSKVKANSYRNVNEDKYLNNELNSNLAINFNNEDENKFDKNKNLEQEKEVYGEFRKILKEKTVKKSNLVRLYKLFMPCFIKKNKNLRLLINLQDFIREELDIVKMNKKLIEYENFKGLFLTENQIKIFNLNQKRVLTEEVLEEEASDYYKEFFFKNKIKELKTFKHLVDNLFNIDEENQYSKPILEKIITNFSL